MPVFGLSWIIVLVSGDFKILTLQKRSKTEQYVIFLVFIEMPLHWHSRVTWVGWYQNIHFIYRLYIWNKICNMDPEHLTRKVFEWSYQELDTGSWESNIYDIFESVNNLDSFENAEELDINHLEIKLADIMHEWSKKLPSKPKLRTYSIFKDEIKTEDYIFSNIFKYKRSLFSCLVEITSVSEEACVLGRKLTGMLAGT